MDFQGHGKLRRSHCVVKDDPVHLAFYVFEVHLTVFLPKKLVYVFHHESKLEYVIVLIAVLYFRDSF